MKFVTGHKVVLSSIDAQSRSFGARYRSLSALLSIMTFAMPEFTKASESIVVFRKSEPHAMTGSQLVKLCVGDSPVVEVWARFPANHSKIAVVERASYHFFVPTGQTWTDWFIGCSAKGYSHSAVAFIQERFRSTKPLPDQNWFSLVGAVDNPRCTPFFIGAGPLIRRMLASGELILFANDAQLFYWNNFGRIQVIVTRVR